MNILKHTFGAVTRTKPTWEQWKAYTNSSKLGEDEYNFMLPASWLSIENFTGYLWGARQSVMVVEAGKRERVKYVGQYCFQGLGEPVITKDGENLNLYDMDDFRTAGYFLAPDNGIYQITVEVGDTSEPAADVLEAVLRYQTWRYETRSPFTETYSTPGDRTDREGFLIPQTESMRQDRRASGGLFKCGSAELLMPYRRAIL